MDKILKIIEEVTMKNVDIVAKELDSNLEFCSSECENSYRKIIEKIDIKLSISFRALF